MKELWNRLKQYRKVWIGVGVALSLLLLGTPLLVAIPFVSNPSMTRREKAALIGGYVLLFPAAFLLFAYWSFPYDRLRDYIVQEAEWESSPGGTRRPSGVELEIVELEPSWLTGVNATGIRLTKLPERPDDEPAQILIDEASARISLLGLIFGNTDVSFDLGLGGGTVEGEYEDDGGTQHVEVELADVNLLTIGILRTAVGLPIRGTLSGTVDLTLAEEMTDTTGSIDLTIEGIKIGDGRAKLAVGDMREGLTIEQIDAGSLHFQANVEEGVAHLEELHADGPDMELTASGTIRLVKPIAMSRVDLLLRVEFKDAYRDRNDRTRTLFTAMDMLPPLRAARTTDGALQYRVTGAPGSRLGTTPAGRSPAPGG